MVINNKKKLTVLLPNEMMNLKELILRIVNIIINNLKESGNKIIDDISLNISFF